MYMCIYIYIYIYIQRERERERLLTNLPPVCKYIYIYIYIQRERETTYNLATFMCEEISGIKPAVRILAIKI